MTSKVKPHSSKLKNCAEISAHSIAQDGGQARFNLLLGTGHKVLAGSLGVITASARRMFLYKDMTFIPGTPSEIIF